MITRSALSFRTLREDHTNEGCNMKLTQSQQKATAAAIHRIALVTARDATGQRRKDAIEHCKRLGIDTSKTRNEL